MSLHEKKSGPRKRMAIIASYFAGETYGLLGPQLAATIIGERTAYACIVITVTRDDDKRLLKKALSDYFGPQRPVIGFSTLSGREDLFDFAQEMRDADALTLLAGPQADVDFLGEVDWQNHPHRFQGLSKSFTFALHGPGEQAVFLLQNLDGTGWQDTPGLLYVGQDGNIIQNPEKTWEEDFLKRVRWDNIYRIGKEGLVSLNVSTGQVLQHIGCPHAGRERWVDIDYPISMPSRHGQKISMLLKGCSFCDVAVDKGFHGALTLETVVNQIQSLPEAADGRKIPFELINENPLPGLPRLLKAVVQRGIGLPQINIILRADWLLSGEKHLREALRFARDTGVYILLSSVGFESFDDDILRNLNKGVNVETNLRAIRLMRQLKEEFPLQWGYARAEGAVHGLIHPTPWDTKESSANVQKTLYLYALPNDILPAHSTPLIVHHASGLAEWIREIEQREGVTFKRYGSVIGWWHPEGNIS
jgi:hypothetical protein